MGPLGPQQSVFPESPACIEPPNTRNCSALPFNLHSSNRPSPGLHALQIFAAATSLAKQGWQYEMKASMVEVYNEEYKDLLGKGPPPGKKHQVE